MFYSKSVKCRQRKTLSMNLPWELLKIFHDLLVGPHHHLQCREETTTIITSSSDKLEVIDWGKLVGTGWYAGKYRYSSWVIWNLSFQRAYQWQVVSSPRTQSGLWRIPRTRYYEEGLGDRGAQPPVWRSEPNRPQHCLLTGRCSWPGTEQRYTSYFLYHTPGTLLTLAR